MCIKGFTRFALSCIACLVRLVLGRPLTPIFPPLMMKESRIISRRPTVPPAMSDIVEDISLDQQFVEFAKMADPKERNGKTIDLIAADYWMRQADVLDDRTVTTTNTGVAFFKFEKSELGYEEFVEYLNDLAETKHLIVNEVINALCLCGLPGSVPVKTPHYKEYFSTWKPKNKLLNIPIDESKY